MRASLICLHVIAHTLTILDLTKVNMPDSEYSNADSDMLEIDGSRVDIQAR